MTSVRRKTLIVVVAFSTVALAAGFMIGRRWQPARPVPASARAKAVDDMRSLPLIPPIQTPSRRFDLTRKPTLADVKAQIAEIAKTNVFRFNKQWEIAIN